jgi:hypothetical protein
MAKGKIVYATIENMKKYANRYGDRVIMYSPYTGEQYSANPGDYFMARPGTKFRDHSHHVMRLVLPQPMRLRQIKERRKPRRSKSKKRK